MRTLVIAYACEPERGSEPGAGWSWARMIAGFSDVTVVTRSNNRDVIEAALPAIPEADRLDFRYVDLPAWSRFWKRGQRGVQLYYLLWQIWAVRLGRALHRSKRFDVVWHLTMTNAWMGSMTPLIDAPFVYGPIGGGVRTPRRLFPALGLRGFAHELVYALLQHSSRLLNPLVRFANRRARLILTQNAETREWLPSATRERTVVFPNAVVPSPERTHQRKGDPHVALYAGRLMASKGVALAVRALVDLPDWELVICGKGEEEARLRSLARSLQVEDRVHFKGWVAREEVSRIMSDEADVFLFPSMHDQAPWVLHEARAAGLPVVCLDGCGCNELATVTVRPFWPRQTARALADGVLRAAAAPPPAPAHYDLATRRDRLVEVLRDAGFAIDSNRDRFRPSR